ncbi:hypothetical protein [Rahnella bonaserana]
MAAAIPFMMIAGSVVGAAGQAQQGAAAKAQADSEASQLNAQAKTSQAQGQIQAMEDRRQARLAESRALAVGAASGADANSTSLVRNISDMEGQGELNALTSLWNGDDQARQLRNQSRATSASGAATKKAANIGAMSSLLQSGGSLYQKYGGKPTAA